MAAIRVVGLVKLANTARQQLAGPIAPGTLDDLRRRIRATLENIERGMEDYGLTVEDLPAPSRKAYRFLKGLDLDAVETSAEAAEEPFLDGSVSIPGLGGQMRRLTDRLARRPARGEASEAHEDLRRTLEGVEDLLEREAIRPRHLSEKARATIGWFRFFAPREWFDAYGEAVGRAAGTFEAAFGKARKFAPPALPSFVPTENLFRVRRSAGGTRIALPVPMVTLPQEAFALLADRAVRRSRHDEAIYRYLREKTYQDAAARFDALCEAGGAERADGAAKGRYHDLAAAFERVNAEYFDGELEAPRLLWSRTFTQRKFGHYDHIHDTVMVSSTLDAPDVPAAVVDFIVYHELLHRHLGLAWRRGRREAHTGPFRLAERKFRDYAAVQAALRRLASGRP